VIRDITSRKKAEEADAKTLFVANMVRPLISPVIKRLTPA
jgi:hypothetical protein